MNFHLPFRRHFPIILLTLLSVLLLSYGISKPFIGHHDWNGAFWGRISRSYASQTMKALGNPDWSKYDGVHPERLAFYYHYPPFLPVLYTSLQLTVGYSEISARFLSILFSAATVFTIYKIGTFLFNKTAGILASLFTILTPLFLYFGKLPDHEPVVTSLMTIAFYGYLRREEKRTFHILFWAASFCALLESWVSVFFLGAIIIHAAITRKPIRFILGVMVVIGTVLLFHFFTLWMAGGWGMIEGFLQYGLVRMNRDPSDTQIIRFTFPVYLLTQARYLVVAYTRIGLGLSAAWVALTGYRIIRKKRISRPDGYLLILAGFPAVYLLVFQNLAYNHDYKIFVLLPFISLSVGFLLTRGLSRAFNTLHRYMPRIHCRIVLHLFLLILFIMAITERFPYLHTLLETSFNQPGRELGLVLAQTTRWGERTLVLSEPFDDFYGEFVRFYSNRPVEAIDVSYQTFVDTPEVLFQYSWIVLIDNRPVDPMLAMFVRQNYSAIRYPEFTLFRTPYTRTTGQ